MNTTLDTANTTNDLDYPTGQHGGRAFATLVARFALAGYQLTRADPDDGPVSYHAARYGLVRCLPTLGDAQQLLAHLEAAPLAKLLLGFYKIQVWAFRFSPSIKSHGVIRVCWLPTWVISTDR